MDINTDSKEIIHNSFIGWIKNKSLQKYFIIIAILEIILAILFMSSMSNLITTFSQITTFEIGLVFEQIISFYTILGLILIPFSLIIIFFNYKIIQVGLKLSKRKSINITFLRYLKFLFYPLFAFLIALFSIFDIKFLAIGIVGGLIFIIGGLTILTNPILGLPIMILGFLLIFVYLIIIAINSIKLTLGQIIYVEKEKTIYQSLQESWTITHGNVINLILFGIMFGIIIMLISGLVSLPSTIYIQMLIDSNFNVLIIFTDLIYQVLLVPSYIMGAYIIICSNMFWVNIYSKLKSKN
jgi:hypothetical protein